MKILYYAALVATLSFGCNNGSNTNEHNEDGHAHDSSAHELKMSDTVQALMEKGGIKIGYFTGSPDFPEAKLGFVKPIDGEKIKEGKVLFKYKVENFELTHQTEDAEHKHANNSHQGQHIHHILNNTPYTAHYTDTFSKKLEPGHYVNLAFLSRSYHESLKHKSAYVLNAFTVTEKNEIEFEKGNSPAIYEAQQMFYSRPKGEYKGKDVEKILLDFYLVNTDLSETGNKVKAIINGNEFILNKWAPYAIYGLPMGENTIELELIDKDGKTVPGEFNKVKRTITLKAE